MSSNQKTKGIKYKAANKADQLDLAIEFTKNTIIYVLVHNDKYV